MWFPDITKRVRKVLGIKTPIKPVQKIGYILPISNAASSSCSVGTIWIQSPNVAVGAGQKALTYFTYENKRKLNNLIDNMSDTDAEKILHKLFEEITKENSEFRLTDDVENALTAMILDKTAGEN